MMDFTMIAVAAGSIVRILASDNTPQQAGLNLTAYVTLAVAVIALVSNFIQRKVKTPADELARADFAYRKIQERLEEVNKDRTYLQEVVDSLRLQLRKADTEAGSDMDEKNQLRNLVEQGELKIRTLTSENAELNNRLHSIADKVRNGEPITLSDVYGNVTEIDGGIDPETEMTRVPIKVNE